MSGDALGRANVINEAFHRAAESARQPDADPAQVSASLDGVTALNGISRSIGLNEPLAIADAEARMEDELDYERGEN